MEAPTRSLSPTRQLQAQTCPDSLQPAVQARSGGASSLGNTTESRLPEQKREVAKGKSSIFPRCMKEGYTFTLRRTRGHHTKPPRQHQAVELAGVKAHGTANVTQGEESLGRNHLVRTVEHKSTIFRTYMSKNQTLDSNFTSRMRRRVRSCQ